MERIDPGREAWVHAGSRRERNATFWLELEPEQR